MASSRRASLLIHVYFVVPSLLLLIFFSAECIGRKDPTGDESVIERFREYLRINTSHPTPNYKAAADFILSQAQSLSLESKVLEFVEGKPIPLLKWAGKDPKLPSILLNSHTDVVPAEPDKWIYPPFEAHVDDQGRIYARGSQDMKCVGLQYLEAIRRLKASGFQPDRTIYLSYVPDEEIGGADGAAKFVESSEFKDLNIEVVLDEGGASPEKFYFAFNGERSPWWLVIKATGAPGHGSIMFDNSAAENLLKSLESVYRFRASQFDLTKAELNAIGEVISVNLAFLDAGTPSTTGYVMNVQPSVASAGFDIRVPPTADEDSLQKRIDQEWAPKSRNMTHEFVQKVSGKDEFGNPILTPADSYNPWWVLLQKAIEEANGHLYEEAQIFPASTDSRYYREKGLQAFGFSPIANTPLLAHDHNEFLSKDEYLKGIDVYEAIIKAYASYVELKQNI